MKALVQGRKIRVGNRILKIILNRINHSIAYKNIQTNPQLVIFSFDHIGLSLNLEGRYENSSLFLIDEFIKSKMPNAKYQTALDIGANIGNHSIFFAKKFKNVYAFEPNPVTYEVLKINCNNAAEYKNIVPLNFGLSDIEGSLPFHINPSNIGGSRIIDVNNPSIKGSTQVNVKKLDHVNEIKDATLLNLVSLCSVLSYFTSSAFHFQRRLAFSILYCCNCQKLLHGLLKCYTT